jgi:hypothetical protein
MIDTHRNELVNVPRSNLEFCRSAEWVVVTPEIYVKFVRMRSATGDFYDVTLDKVTQGEADGWTIYEPVPPALTREGYNGWLWAERVSITSPNGSLHWVTPHVANIYANLFGFTRTDMAADAFRIPVSESETI